MRDINGGGWSWLGLFDCDDGGGGGIRGIILGGSGGPERRFISINVA